ncbi:hypothetical protein WOLCODRAFT_150847 [Wolfiporia cocos MD-104 SS10]|uniref:F-box domain-containing protein n=1 Tax=Wolfiporia cocos (strain MD-104) TaxID=742152 RepID=A0A2H3JPU2_WOLCO|nr:hypothetical protein WOLCODRAFT_150847 [Wolfiporia cocos MD-104 SS10]
MESIQTNRSILDLPNELLMAIKECIPLSDVRTHVCFNNCCTRISSLYDLVPDEFWRQALFYSGISPEDDDEHETFKNAALDYIASDGFCTHPWCGGQLLEYNAREMESLLEGIPGILHLFDEDSDLPDYELAQHGHPLLAHVTLHTASGRFIAPTEEAEQSTWSVVKAYHKVAGTATLNLAYHPIARRTFATWPPLRSMSLTLYLDPAKFWGVEVPDVLLPDSVSEYGVAVGDVISALHEGWYEPCSLNELADWVDDEGILKLVDVCEDMETISSPEIFTICSAVIRLYYAGISLSLTDEMDEGGMPRYELSVNQPVFE